MARTWLQVWQSLITPRNASISPRPDAGGDRCLIHGQFRVPLSESYSLKAARRTTDTNAAQLHLMHDPRRPKHCGRLRQFTDRCGGRRSSLGPGFWFGAGAASAGSRGLGWHLRADIRWIKVLRFSHDAPDLQVPLGLGAVRQHQARDAGGVEGQQRTLAGAGPVIPPPEWFGIIAALDVLDPARERSANWTPWQRSPLHCYRNPKLLVKSSPDEVQPYPIRLVNWFMSK
jgi:hypothetical protein